MSFGLPRRAAATAAAFCVFSGLTTLSAHAFLVLPQVPVTAACLPPAAPYAGYVGQGASQYSAGLGTVVLANLDSFGFSGCFTPPSTGSAVENYTSAVGFTVSINGGTPAPQFVANVPFSVTVTFAGTASNVTTYNTQLTAMNITVPGTMMVRIDPRTPSTGTTTITDLGGGNFTVSSFFDIFTDISTDGGGSWTPDIVSDVIVYAQPEPASLAILGGALLALSAVRRRRNR